MPTGTCASLHILSAQAGDKASVLSSFELLFPLSPNRLRSGNTAFHIAIMHCRNESYRYLVSLLRAEFKVDRRVELIGPGFRNAAQLTPVQLAAKGGGRCTQKPVSADKDLTVWPRLLGPDGEKQYLLFFCMQLHEVVSWTFGGVQRVWFPVTQLLEGNLANKRVRTVRPLRGSCCSAVIQPLLLS